MKIGYDQNTDRFFISELTDDEMCSVYSLIGGLVDYLVENDEIDEFEIKIPNFRETIKQLSEGILAAKNMSELI